LYSQFSLCSNTQNCAKSSSFILKLYKAYFCGLQGCTARTTRMYCRIVYHCRVVFFLILYHFQNLSMQYKPVNISRVPRYRKVHIICADSAHVGEKNAWLISKKYNLGNKGSTTTTIQEVYPWDRATKYVTAKHLPGNTHSFPDKYNHSTRAEQPLNIRSTRKSKKIQMYKKNLVISEESSNTWWCEVQPFNTSFTPT
jgi:hypothetical protein